MKRFNLPIQLLIIVVGIITAILLGLAVLIRWPLDAIIRRLQRDLDELDARFADND